MGRLGYPGGASGALGAGPRAIRGLAGPGPRGFCLPHAACCLLILRTAHFTTTHFAGIRFSAAPRSSARPRGHAAAPCRGPQRRPLRANPFLAAADKGCTGGAMTGAGAGGPRRGDSACGRTLTYVHMRARARRQHCTPSITSIPAQRALQGAGRRALSLPTLWDPWPAFICQHHVMPGALGPGPQGPLRTRRRVPPERQPSGRLLLLP